MINYCYGVQHHPTPKLNSLYQELINLVVGQMERVDDRLLGVIHLWSKYCDQSRILDAIGKWDSVDVHGLVYRDLVKQLDQLTRASLEIKSERIIGNLRRIGMELAIMRDIEKRVEFLRGIKYRVHRVMLVSRIK